MILAGLRKLKETFFVSPDQVERKKIEDKLKLEELLDELREEDSSDGEVDSMAKRQPVDRPNPEVQWNCTRAEGVKLQQRQLYCINSHALTFRKNHFAK